VIINKNGITPINGAEFMLLTRVGYFSRSELRFSNARAGAGSNLILNLTAAMKLVAGDRIDILLPSFSGPSNESLAMKSSAGPVSAWNVGIWNNQTSTLSLSLQDVVPAGTMVALTIYAENVVKIPALGVRPKQADILISTNATWGPMSPALLTYLQPVGTVVMSNLTWLANARAGGGTSLTLDFEAEMKIDVGETITLHLPHFTMSSVYSHLLNISVCPHMKNPCVSSDDTWVDSSGNGCEWYAEDPDGRCGFEESRENCCACGGGVTASTTKWEAATSTLVFTLNCQINPKTGVSLHLPSSAGLVLPQRGLRASSNETALSIQAADGPMMRTPFTKVQGVGFMRLVVTFPDPVVNMPTAFVASFTPEMQIGAGEHVDITLGRFYGCPSNGSVIQSAFLSSTCVGSASCTSVETGERSAVVSLTVGPSAVMPGVTCTVAVSSGVGILVPDTGVLDNAEKNQIKISSDAKDGEMLPTGALDSGVTTKGTVTTIGSMASTRVSFWCKSETCRRCGANDVPRGCSAAGKNVPILIEYTPRMRIAIGDNITIKLPGFKRNAIRLNNKNFTAADTSGSTGFSNVATWNMATLEVDGVFIPCIDCLQFKMSKTVNAFTPMCFLLGPEIGIKLPVDGIRHMQPSLTIQTDAQAGRVGATTFNTIESVGGFQVSAISYSKPYLGNSVDVTLTLNSYASLLPATRIRVSVPGFSIPGQLGRNVSFTYTSSMGNATPFAQFSGNLTTPELEYNISEEIPAGSQFSMTVSAVHGIWLPSEGLRVNSQGLQISSNSAMGPVNCEQIIDSPGIQPNGTFQMALLTFNPPKASERVVITFRFKANMTLFPGDNITLQMPGFGCECGEGNSTEGNSTEGNSTYYYYHSIGPFSKIEWNSSLTQLVLRAGQIIPGETTWEAAIDLGITLPVNGNRKDSTDIKIFVSALSGPAKEGKVSSQAVGSFSASPRIVLSDPKAGSATDVVVSFTADMALSAYESIVILLPRFGGNPFEDLKVEAESNAAQNPCLLVEMEFVDEGQSCQLTMQLDVVPRNGVDCPTTIAPLTHYRVVIPSSAGITVPAHGIAGAETGFSISSSAVAGPVLPTIIKTFPTVGSFIQTSITMSAIPTTMNPLGLAQAAVAAEIVVKFTPRFTIRLAERVNFSLPDFAGNSFRGLLLDSNTTKSSGSGNETQVAENRSSFLTSWNTSTKTLTFELNSGVIQIGYLVSIKVPNISSIGIILPTRGVRENSTNLTIRTDAIAGPVPPTSIDSVQGVGVFLDSRLDFSPAKANFSSTIGVSVSAPMPMNVGDQVIIHLPGFSGDDFNEVNVSSVQYSRGLVYTVGNTSYVSYTNYSGGIEANMTWNNTASQLSIVLKSPAPAAANIRFECNQSFGVRLPVLGVRANQVYGLGFRFFVLEMCFVPVV
jgi:hypothetical protein